MSTASITVVEAPADPFIGLPFLFRQCASPRQRETSRYRTDAPFAQAGHVYATDGIVAVRLPLDKVATPHPSWSDDSRRLPRVATAWATYGPWEPEPTPLPLVSHLERVVCGRCDADGEVECDLGHYHPCPECHGAGDRLNDDPTQVGRLTFKAYYLARLQQQGVAGLYLPVVDPDPKTYTGPPARFVLGDLEGVIVPLAKKPGTA